MPTLCTTPGRTIADPATETKRTPAATATAKQPQTGTPAGRDDSTNTNEER